VSNGGEFSTGNPLVDAALKRLSGDYQGLKDAMIVQAHLEKSQGESLQRHERFLAKHEKIMGELEDTMTELLGDSSLERHAKIAAEHDTWMREIEEKLNALTMWLMRREGLPEAGAQ
jgi:hypothetical protein